MWRTLDQPRLRTIQVPGSAHWAPDAALLYGLLRGANDHLPDGANGHLLGGANGHLPAGANDHLLGGANGRLLAGANGRLLAGANVEKLIYLLMDGDPEIASTLRTETVAAVRAAGGKRIQVNVIDAALGPPFGVSPEPDVQQLTAAISVWVNTAESAPLEALLPPAGPGAGWLGYLVTEAEPLPNTTVTPDPDGRVPGFAQLVPLRVPDGLGWGEWRRRWQGTHTSVALGTQSTFRYVQNVVLRPLTARAPRYAAIVEECFPLAAATDLHVFFDAVGDEAKLARHMAAMSESCDRFMDGVAPVAWTAEYLFADGA